MKLQILPARAGLEWVKLGMQTFFKQPLALGGLFFMFIAVVSVVAIIPVLGNLLGLMIVPAATLGLMVATLEALRGKFPMPSILAIAFRSGQQRLRAMLVLGAMYAAGFLLVMGVTALFDGGQFAKLYLIGGKLSRELLEQPEFQNAATVGVALYMPLSVLFWHAPALVHWHQVPPGKAVFFSAVACLRNFKAYALYGLAWLAVFMGGTMLIVSALAVMGLAGMAAAAIVPLALTVAAMFFSSIYFTFRDSFVHSEDNLPANADPAPPNPPQ
jgi:hypothetical protein